jgi:hypothetical protein
MVWTEEDLRQLRQDSPARIGRMGCSAAPEEARWNERERLQKVYSVRDPAGLFWGIVEPCLTPEERRIWSGEQS